MIRSAPFPVELVQMARKVVWYDRPELTLADLPMFLAHLMVYGSMSDVAIVERHVPEEEFRRALENAPAGIFCSGCVAEMARTSRNVRAASASAAVSRWIWRP